MYNRSTENFPENFNHLLIDKVEAVNLVQIEHTGDADDYWLHVPYPVHSVILKSVSACEVSLLGEARVLIRGSNNPDLLC